MSRHVLHILSGLRRELYPYSDTYPVSIDLSAID